MGKKWDAIKKYIADKKKWIDGGLFIGLGLLILFLTPLAKIAAGVAILYGLYKIFLDKD